MQEKQITGVANAKKNNHVKLFEKGGEYAHKMLEVLSTDQKCTILAITLNLAKLHNTSANLAFWSVFPYLMKQRVLSRQVGSLVLENGKQGLIVTCVNNKSKSSFYLVRCSSKRVFIMLYNFLVLSCSLVLEITGYGALLLLVPTLRQPRPSWTKPFWPIKALCW